MKTRKRINPVSARRKRANAIYAKLKRHWLLAHPKCQVSGGRATDVHHMRGRVGTLLIDTRFWMAVSREAHAFVHDHQTIARDQGWIAPTGKWNVPPKDAETERLKDLLR